MTRSELGRYRRIYSQEWYAPEFRQLTAALREVYFYCRTGPQTTSVGIFRLSGAVAVEDVGDPDLTVAEFDARLDAVCRAFGWRFDPASRVLWMPAWIEENPPNSSNVCLAWRKFLLTLPRCPFIHEAAAAIAESLKDKPQSFIDAFGRFPTVVPTAVPTVVPTAVPTVVPTAVPTVVPTTNPTTESTTEPTTERTTNPTTVRTTSATFQGTQRNRGTGNKRSKTNPRAANGQLRKTCGKLAGPDHGQKRKPPGGGRSSRPHDRVRGHRQQPENGRSRLSPRRAPGNLPKPQRPEHARRTQPSDQPGASATGNRMTAPPSPTTRPKTHALCARPCGRVCLSRRLFNEFVLRSERGGRIARANAEAFVRSWHRRVNADWSDGGAHATDPVQTSAVAFWRARWIELVQADKRFARFCE